MQFCQQNTSLSQTDMRTDGIAVATAAGAMLTRGKNELAVLTPSVALAAHDQGALCLVHSTHWSTASHCSAAIAYNLHDLRRDTGRNSE